MTAGRKGKRESQSRVLPMPLILAQIVTLWRQPRTARFAADTLKLLGQAREDRPSRPVLVGEHPDPRLAAQEIYLVEQVDHTKA
jgi:hypothetical protein